MKGMGTIVSLKGNKAVVRVVHNAGCFSCGEGGHCVSAKVPDREITVLNDINAAVDDRIVFESEPGKVVFLSLILWVLPVVSLIVGYLAGKAFGGNAVAVIVAFAFFFLTFAALGLFDRFVSGGRTFYPHIVTVVPPGEDGVDMCR